MAYPSLKLHILFYSSKWSSYLAGFDKYQAYIKVNYGRKSSILNLIRVEIIQGMCLPETAYFFNINCLAICLVLPDIRHNNVNYGR